MSPWVNSLSAGWTFERCNPARSYSINTMATIAREFAKTAIVGSALLACSAAPKGAPDSGGTAAANIGYSERCSTFGVMACNAMALLSSGSAPTCSASRGLDGARIESCGTVPITADTDKPAPAQPGLYPVRLAWSDNSDNESEFVIERCDEVAPAPLDAKTTAACTGAWKSVANVTANTTSYTDHTAAVNHTYIYRVKAINRKGSSDYTAEAVIKTPSR